MTKKQMMSLKPGDIVVDKANGDEFKVVRMLEIKDIVPKSGKFEFVNARTEIAAELIPGFKYSRPHITNGPYFVFSHKKMAVKENS